MAEACAVLQESNPSAEGQRSSHWDTMTGEDTAIAVLSCDLKRPVLSDANDDDGPTPKKQCLEDESTRKDITILTEAADQQTTPTKEAHQPTTPTKDADQPTTSTREADQPTAKVSPGKPPKYRASSPTIMTTRGKRHKSDPHKESTVTMASHKRDQDCASSSSSTLDGGDNNTSCVVPGCHVTGWSNPDVRWYRIPKEEKVRQVWLNKIGRPDLDEKEHHRICSSHFVGGRKTFDRILPSIGVPTSSPMNEGAADLLTVITPQANKTQVVPNKKAFLSNKPWFSRWSITGNNAGSMCCIPGCKSTRRRNLALKYYRFPKEENLRHRWLSSIGVRNFMPRDNSRVCSTHFEGGARSDKNSVPLIFSPDTVALQNMKQPDQQQAIKEEPVERLEDAIKEEHAFHRQISPRKQAVPHRLPKAGAKTYGNYCCVAGCNSKYVDNPKLSFYRIPRKSKVELRQQWIAAIGAHNITSSEARVCSLHFEGGRKTENCRVPTIFPAVTKSPGKQHAKHKAKKQKLCDEYQADIKWPKCAMSTPQSNIETLLHASDILSQREAESRSNTPPSSSVSSPMRGGSSEGSHLLPETPKGSSCMVPGCNNTRSNSKGRLRWYRVPKDETQRRLWLNAIGWPNAVPIDTTRICSAHFIEGIYRKKGDKAVPTIFPPKPKDWQERHPLFIQDKVKVEPNQEVMPCAVPVSPSHSMSPIVNPSSPRGSSPRGDQPQGILSFVTRNHFQAHPYGPTMLRPEMFERSPKHQAAGESRGVTCCVARCHNNTKRTPGLRWYRIPADPSIRQQWVSFISITRPDFVPKNHHRVCSAHFEGGMKFSKSSVPSVYDKPFNRRFLPPADQQQGEAPPDGEPSQQMAQDLNWQQQQHSLDMVEIQRQALEQQLPTMQIDMTGPGGDASTNVCKVIRVENSNSPIRERCIPPLTYREDLAPVYVNQEDVEVSHEISIPFTTGQLDSPSKVANEDLSLSSVLAQEGMEPKKRVGGGGQCFVPGCNNTRRHKPGLKWYRIPKDVDLRILWLDNIGCPNADPKPHNRVCSDHFEGGYKQFNSSLPTIEKWSETSQYVYTGKPVVDPTSSVVGSSLLAVDDNPEAVDASTPRVTPSAAEMQSLADSLTALAAELASKSVNVATPGAATPPSLSALDQSTTSDSPTVNSDNVLASLEATTSRSRSTSRSSSVATYASSGDEDGDRIPGINSKVDTADDQTRNSAGTQDEPMDASGHQEGCCSSTQNMDLHMKTKDLTQQEHCVSDRFLKTISLEDKLPVKPPIFEESGKTESADNQGEGGSSSNNVNKVADIASRIADQEKMTPEERIQYLEGLVQSMCEELRFKDQKLQEKTFDLTSCVQKLQDKEAECERIKRKCLMMSVRLSSFRKLAQTDL